jgi:iron-sulfur cluster repair protein YtfE (RIC family)
MARFTQLLRQQYQAFQPCLEHLRFVAAEIGEVPLASLQHELEAVCAFLLYQLGPHTQVADQVLYPLVEHVLAAPGATATLRGEQDEIRRLTDELLVLCATLTDEPFLLPDQAQALHRVLSSLATLVTGHLAKEETMYLPLLAARLTAAADHGVLVVIEMVTAKLKYDP